jgi:3-phosphoshikimate 1-carboxyvinyltransferase
LNNQYKTFEIQKGQKYKAANVTAEGDWSGIAFMLVAAAISGEIQVDGISYLSKQGDKAIVDVLKMCGAIVNIEQNSVRVIRNELHAFEFDATDVPDLFPPLVSLALNCLGKSIIKGVSRLKHKESDRGQTLQMEFNKLGANIRIENDSMIIEGCNIHGGNVYSHNDHRIAMALAVAALNSDSQIVIENSEAVGKSWPDFFERLKELGASIE